MDAQSPSEPQDQLLVPASFAQRRIWFLDQLEPGTPLYNVPVRLWFEGGLDAGVLEAALREMARRHESLRTTFASRGGEVFQAIGSDTTLALRVVNLDDLADTEEQAAKLAEAEFQQAFDLASGPLWRAVLLRVAPRRHLLALTLHHIIFDGWSLNILIRELAALYQAFSAGQGSPLPELDWQYRQFAICQAESMKGPGMDRQMAYWRESLRGPLPVVQVHSRAARSSGRRSAGTRLAVKLPGPMTARLKSLARQEAATAPMVLLTAFDALLCRYTDQPDVIVGLPVAGRNRVETEGLIGFFVNTLALRVDVSGDPSFRELLRQVRRVTLDAYENQDVPFEMVVAEAQPERQPGRNPLFDVMFAYQGKPPAPLVLPDLTLTVPAVVAEAAKFDLMLEVLDGEEMEAALIYDSDLLDAAESKGMLRHFTCLLAEALAQPDRALSQLSLMTQAERQQILVEWNRTTTDYPHRSLQELFEEQVARTPDAIAVDFEEQCIGYAELNRRANQVAHWLRERGVVPDTMVGLCAERGIEMLVGMLAIVKAGGAYVPLDPGYPQSRLAFMLEDTATSLVLTESRFRHLFAAKTLCLDSEWQQVSHCSTANPPSAAGFDHLAYLIYTSGSTGQPKAALIPQRGVVRLVKATNYVSLTSDEVILQFAPISFDASTFEIWGALLNGGRLVVFPPYTPSLEELGRFIRDRRITTLWLTAGLFHQMIERESPSLSGVRQLLAGGEALSAWHVREAQRQLPGCRLINGYGPTENTTFTCCAELSGEQIGTSAPIGRPIANTRVYILDRDGQPAPAGVPGELYIGGDGLARGYWRRPELTAERFVASALDPGGQLYRTGDRVRWRADGQIEFLGRMDQQLKIRGFRVEPGEIEAALSTHPNVRQAAVVAREHPAGFRSLVAYVVGGATTDELRQHLRGLLPDYMLPSQFLLVSEMPLGPTGKVDRAALLMEAEKLSNSDAGLPASETWLSSRTPVQEQLAGIWGELLGCDQIGLNDDFFSIGGHSLLATQVISRVRDVFHVELPLRSLFEAHTIAEFSERVESARHESRPVAPAIQPAVRGDRVPLSFAQQRLWFLDRMTAQQSAYNVPVRVEFAGSLDPQTLDHSLAAFLQRHEVLRTAFPVIDGQPAQSVTSAEGFSLPVIDVTQRPEPEIEGVRIADEEGRRPFDLSTGPLMRALLIRLSPDRHTLLLTFHHTVFDGWSFRILAHEISEFYTGNSARLLALPVQYADYAVWQQDWMAGKVMEQQLAYWRERLQPPFPVLELAADRPRPAVQTFQGGWRRRTFSTTLTRRLHELSRQEGVTLFMMLLAGFQALLHRYTGQTDIIVGSPVAGRSRIEIEGLIGCFVNTLALRTDLTGDPNFRELIARVREVTLGAWAHQDLPFEKLVEELRPDRLLSHTPIFQVVFSLLSLPATMPAIPGITTTIRMAASDGAKFDLTLDVLDGDQLQAVFNYNTDLFEGPFIERMLAHLERLLEAATTNMEQRLSELPVLNQREREELRAWGEGARARPDGRLIHEWIEEHAARTPETLAVACGSERLSFAELNRRANQLAWHLRGLGVGVDTPVAVCFERSVSLVVAVLGVIKAGGAYVPLDPQYPRARLEYLLDDSRAAVVVTAERWQSRLTGRAVLLDQDWPVISSLPAANPGRHGGPESLAYIVYTSGSSGQPKGVAVEHRGLMNLVNWHRCEYEVTSRDRATQVASPSFDAMGWEIWPYLAAGASVHIPEDELRLRPDQLAAWLAEQEITLSFLPTPLAEAMLENGHPDGLRLRALLTGGDRLHRSWAGLPFPLMNHYGPTESSVVATWCEVKPDDVPPPIGRPVTNTRVYVLDESRQLVPAGLPGELYIGGEGLARGYWRRPELTAERFVRSALDPGGRLYRTGDRVRWQADGRLEFLGRIDQQLKIRGFRVEPGEIEAALLERADIGEAVLVARGEGESRRLAAYYTGPATAEQLRVYLRTRLPEYMVPAVFVQLAQMPLTPNGKLDRSALPDPEAVTISEPPRTEIEQQIGEIWRDVLGIDSVNVHDNFMDLGGHSLLIARVHSQLETLFSRTFPMIELFRRPTIRDLAGFLAEAAGDSATMDHIQERADRQKQAQRQIRQNRKRKPYESTAHA